MSRINSSSVQVGASRVIGSEKKDKKDNFNPEVMLTLQKAQLEAKQILNIARSEAEKLITAAQLEAQQQALALMEKSKQDGLEEGYKAGLEQGYNEGYDRVSQEMAHKLSTLDTLAKASFDMKKQILTSAEKEILELSLLLAEKLVKTKLDIEPELVGNIIKSAISELKEKDEIRLVINPELAQKVYEIIDGIKEEISGVQCIKILEDKTVPPDGVIVESVDTRIDARLGTQVGELTKALLEEYARRPVLDDTAVRSIKVICGRGEEFYGVADEVEIVINSPEIIQPNRLVL